MAAHDPAWAERDDAAIGRDGEHERVVSPYVQVQMAHGALLDVSAHEKDVARAMLPVRAHRNWAHCAVGLRCKGIACYIAARAAHGARDTR